METTNGLIEELEAILARNVDLYKEMEEVLRAERAALESHSLPRIESCVNKKSGVTFQIKSLEDRRLAILDAISKATGVSRKDLNMDKIISLAPAKSRSRLQTLRNNLKERYEISNELNSFNRGVVERLINLNHAFASTLQNLLQPESTYQKKAGATRPDFKSGQVVSRVL